MGMSALEVRRRVMMAQPHEAVASGAIASFVTDVLSPLPLEFDLEPIQAGTGDPSPENKRPITGHDGFTRTGTGKNLVDFSVIANQGSNVTEIENGYAFTSTSTQYSTGIVFSPPLTGVYTLSAKCKNGTGKNFRLRIHYSDGTTNESNATGTEEGFVTLTKTSNSTKSIDSIRFNWSSSGTFEVKELQLEQGTVATAYQPFGHSYETDFPTPPGTVYGGHVKDNGDGTYDLTVTKTGRWLSTLTWGNNASFANVFNGYGWEDRKVRIDGTNGVAICDTYEFYTSSDVANNDYGIALANTTTSASMYNIYVKNKDCANKDAFVALLQEHDVFVVCPLQTPVQYTGLSLTALQSLIGQNHVWVDNADSVSVEYWGH